MRHRRGVQVVFVVGRLDEVAYHLSLTNHDCIRRLDLKGDGVSGVLS